VVHEGWLDLFSPSTPALVFVPGDCDHGVNAAITIRIGFQRMSNITGVQQGNVKVDKTFA